MNFGMCGRWRNGRLASVCTMAGTEECDFECPHRDEPSEERDTCKSCMGTGIGNPHVERSVCGACNGRGVIQPPKPPADEDRWAWNHFEPEPGDEDASGVRAGEGGER